MKVLEKIEFDGFDWLDLENMPASDGYKFEIYPNNEIQLSDYILLFYSLFGAFKEDLVVGQFGESVSWGDFCLETWDITKNEYNYSPNDKSIPAAKYLRFLEVNQIDPNYIGYCKCNSWDRFLPIIMDCITKHIAPYSVVVYNPIQDYAFYFHHTFSIGFYYRKVHEQIFKIIEQAKDEKLIITNSDNDVIKKFIKDFN